MKKYSRRRFWFSFIIGLLLVDSLVAWWWYRGWRDRRFDTAIAQAAARYKVDPALIKAVVWRESRFDPRARGNAGEVGLMQIREPAANEWAQSEGITGFLHATLVDPGSNTFCGTWYLAKLLRRYPGADEPAVFALAEYNAGRTHALRWNHGTGETNSALFLSQITFPGTRDYIRSVLERRELYRGAFPAKSTGEF